MSQHDLAAYRDRLFGLIPEERIRQVRIGRPPAELIERYRRLAGGSPLLADVLDRLGVMGVVPASQLQPVLPNATVVGPALTLRYALERLTPSTLREAGRPAKLADRDVYALAEPGDVAVFDAGGLGISCMGGLSCRAALALGVAGSIVYGGVRDIPTIRDLGYPVWAHAVTPLTGKYRLEAIELNGVVTLAGIQVVPGDLIYADATGVIVVPQEMTQHVVVLAEEADRKEQEVERLLAQGDVAAARRALPPHQW